MNDHDILLELLEAKNRLERQRKIELIVAVVLIVALAAGLFFAWARISATTKKVEESLVKVDAAMEKVQGVFDALADAGIEDPGQAIRDLYDNTEKVRNLFDELKKSGFDDPTQVLRDLREASERLNELFDRLSEMYKQGFGQNIEQGIEQGVEQGKDALEGVMDLLAGLLG